jgi:AraC-like DNA-binding protein
MTMIKHKATVSMALTNILLEYIGKIGIDPHKLCESAGIALPRLKDMDDRIGADRFGALWDAAVKKAGDPDFGLHCMKDVAHNFPGGHILFSVVLNCPTVEKAMQKFFQYHDLMNDVVKPKMELDNDVFYVTWDLFDPAIRLPRHICEALLSVYFYILRNLTQNKVELVEVRFAHRQPEDITEHQNIFQVPLRFEQPRNEIVVKRKYLDFPLFLANPELLETLEQFAKTRMGKINHKKSWTSKTIHAINQKMAKGEDISIHLIAKTMGLSIRNLQNKLKEEKNTFQSIFNDVRKTIAFQYLKREEVSNVDIAFLLGFSEQSAFNHAFKRWTGTTPREYVKMQC